jgi:excisionase family DNA binding protein
MSTSEQLLRPAQIAPLLGVSTSRVYQLIAAGVIPATRVGGALRIPCAAWERWLATQSERALASLGPSPVEEVGKGAKQLRGSCRTARR